MITYRTNKKCVEERYQGGNRLPSKSYNIHNPRDILSAERIEAYRVEREALVSIKHGTVLSVMKQVTEGPEWSRMG